MSSKKCHKCDLVNYASAEVCKRCGAKLTPESAVEPFEVGLDIVTAPPVGKPASANLFPCPDCEHVVSRFAEACPSCGRFFARYGQKSPDRWWWAQTIAWGVIVSGFLIVMLVVLLALGGLFAAGPRR